MPLAWAPLRHPEAAAETKRYLKGERCLKDHHARAQTTRLTALMFCVLACRLSKMEQIKWKREQKAAALSAPAAAAAPPPPAATPGSGGGDEEMPEG